LVQGANVEMKWLEEERPVLEAELKDWGDPVTKGGRRGGRFGGGGGTAGTGNE